MPVRSRTQLRGADGIVLGDIEPPQQSIQLVKDNPTSDNLWKNWLFSLFTYAGIVNENFLTVEDWNTATLIVPWVVAAGRTVQYYIDPYGRVHIRGAVTGGTGDIFTLPTGYRPDQDVYFCCYQSGAAEVRVNTSGVVSLTTAGTGGLTLDQISFRI